MSTDDTIERTKVREVAAIFHSRGALDAAVDALLLAGFDRADIDIIADLDEVQRRIGPAYVAPEELADISRVPRRPVIEPEDIAGTVAMVAGVVAFSAAGAVIFAVMHSGGSAMTAAATALLAAAAAGGIAGVLTYRRLVPEKSQSLERQMAALGLILWVRVRSPEREEKAQQILRQHGGRAIRVHEIEVEKRAEEIPLSKLRPDPWLGKERLGQP
ncbi:MAG TPA: hypothetical protein VGI22_13385 [Xanthobacteraceae bacterium]|jgi:hypothetical protein